MPKAVVIEFTFNTPSTDWQIVTNNSHGNTVRSSFLAFAESGWTCDVRLANYGTIYAFYDYVARLNETPYDLAICSWVVDSYYIANLEKIATEYGIPLFMPRTNLSKPTNTDRDLSKKICFVGSLSQVQAWRNNTYDIASNLSGSNQNATSYTTAVVAGKSTKLINAGFTFQEVYDAINEQASNFPEWNAVDGFGQAPIEYAISIPTPEPEPEPPPSPEPEPEPPFIPTIILQPKTQVWISRN